MAIVLSGTTNDILVNGVSVATDTEVSSAVAPKADSTYVDSQVATRGRLVQGTAVASTSGTTIDFTGIPSWVKRITVMFNGVSTSGTSYVQIQIGSTTIQTTGYVCTATYMASSTTVTVSGTTGLLLVGGNNATDSRVGIANIVNFSGNTWVMSQSHESGTNAQGISNGNVTLSGTLDRVRVTTVNGTDTFDAGSINIMYEG